MSKADSAKAKPVKRDFQVEYDQNGFPKTILDWRKEPPKTWDTVRHLWIPLEHFFEQNDYVLFITNKKNNSYFLPKDVNEKRAPDPYHHVLPEDQREYGCRTPSNTNKLCPATRKSDGTHVIIHLVCKAGHGQNELDVLRYFSKPGIKDDPQNHVIPLIDELHYLDMSFAIVPLLYDEPCNYPWFLNLSEALDAIHQSFEALAFLHRQLVAHRDIGSGEFLYNFGGSLRGPQYLAARQKRGPLRSLFPCRYYLIDFETSVQFEKTSLPDERLVSGMAAFANHGIADPSRYGKTLPPEWNADQPYSPFASDVFQIAGMWKALFYLKGKETLGLVEIWQRMMSTEPADRPTMAEAVDMLASYQQSLTVQQLAYQVQRWSSYRAKHGKPQRPRPIEGRTSQEQPLSNQ